MGNSVGVTDSTIVLFTLTTTLDPLANSYLFYKLILIYSIIQSFCSHKLRCNSLAEQYL